jgi:Cu(I)/Ag(I) efflux system membrane protein CusA/SilA
LGFRFAWSARNVLLVLIASLFAAAGGLYALGHLPLDAIPDLSDTQVIAYTEDPGQAPQVVEDQVTYPLTTAMLTVPNEGGAWILVLRGLHRLHYFRRRDE